MINDLEKFVAGPNLPAQSYMRVTLGKTHILTFNQRVYRTLGKPPAVYLYYSRSRQVIAMEPTQSNKFMPAFPIL